jgi:hypothetical protein
MIEYTDTNLLVGGVRHGQRYISAPGAQQALVAKPPPPLARASNPTPSADDTFDLYTRDAIKGTNEFFLFWRHARMTPDDAIRAIFDSFPK